MIANALRAHLAELGLVANPGITNLAKLAEQALSDKNALPAHARTSLGILVRQIMAPSDEITALDRQLMAWHAESEASRRLAAIPGLGVITATAIAATVTDPDQFRSGRQFAAWLGLTPQQHSTGGKTRLGGISKQGDRYLRRLARRRRHRRDPPHKGQANAHGELDQKAHGEEAVQARLRRAGQQARPDRMGRADAKRSLSAL